jgi:hypothetical protein
MAKRGGTRGDIGDIDAIRGALRPRMGSGGGAPAPAPSTTVAPHTHSADQITTEPAGHNASVEVQATLTELDDEKLARDGSQTMLGALDMDHHSISNVDDVEIEGTATVREDVVLTGAVGLAKVSGIRVLTLSGSEANGEARVESINALAFNAVVPTVEVGRLAWDSVEGALCAFVVSGA